MSADRPLPADQAVSADQAVPGGRPDFMNSGFTPADRAVMRFAATVLLVRDAPGGVEVFMQQRHAAADFGGMYVFPGGKVDPADSHGEVAAFCDGVDDRIASAQLGLPDGGLAFWIAALRECFEECGVLLAHDARDLPVDPAAAPARFHAYQQQLRDGGIGLADICRAEGMRLSVQRMLYFSHWITPEGPPRRYDTRFFIAEVAADQRAGHDEWESIDSVWTRPEVALARRAAGELQMIYPTLTTLESISGSPDVATLLQRVRRGAHLPEWTPERGRQGMQRVDYVSMPGVAEPAPASGDAARAPARPDRG